MESKQQSEYSLYDRYKSIATTAFGYQDEKLCLDGDVIIFLKAIPADPNSDLESKAIELINRIYKFKTTSEFCQSRFCVCAEERKRIQEIEENRKIEEAKELEKLAIAINKACLKLNIQRLRKKVLKKWKRMQRYAMVKKRLSILIQNLKNPEGY